MMNAPKFTIGQLVRFANDNEGEAGNVLSFSFDPEVGYTYKISARELDIPNKQIIEGVKICREDELVEVAPVAPSEPTEGVQA